MPQIECMSFVSQSQTGLRELGGMVRSSRERNAQLGISGLMLYDGTYFFSYLEGEPEPLQRLNDAISADPRHVELRPLDGGPLAQRRYDRWLMGYLYAPKFSGELEALWNGSAALGDIGVRLQRWVRQGDVL